MPSYTHIQQKNPQVKISAESSGEMKTWVPILYANLKLCFCSVAPDETEEIEEQVNDEACQPESQQEIVTFDEKSMDFNKMQQNLLEHSSLGFTDVLSITESESGGFSQGMNTLPRPLVHT